MENEELIKRARELSLRSEEQGVVASTGFLTPAEQEELLRSAEKARLGNLLLFGGNKDCERKIAFFLPFYIEKEAFEADEYIFAIHAETRFSNPGHRDYLGAILGLGIKRECIGDIYISGEQAYFYCLPAVAKHILQSLDKIGKFGAKLKAVRLSDVILPAKEMKEISFTVQSMRLDAVAAGMFSMSRSAMADYISAGAVYKNYKECLKADADVFEGDIISVKGHGKGKILSCGGTSRKGRIFVNTGIFI